MQWPEFTAIALDGNKLNIWKITTSQGTRGGHWNLVWLISFLAYLFSLVSVVLGSLGIYEEYGCFVFCGFFLNLKKIIDIDFL